MVLKIPPPKTYSSLLLPSALPYITTAIGTAVSTRWRYMKCCTNVRMYVRIAVSNFLWREVPKKKRGNDQIYSRVLWCRKQPASQRALSLLCKLLNLLGWVLFFYLRWTYLLVEGSSSSSSFHSILYSQFSSYIHLLMLLLPLLLLFSFIRFLLLAVEAATLHTIELLLSKLPSQL